MPSKNAEKFDVIIIGAGPGGYVAAIRCAQLGLKTAVVEKRKTFGGTCLNVGCIPSKALLAASEKYEDAAHHMKDMGIETSVKLNLKTMMKHKTDVIDANTKGIEFLFKKNKITSIEGEGSIVAAGKVKVGKNTYETENIIIATGSDVISLPDIKIDEKRIVSSTGALELPEVPKKMIVIGGGVIGLELGTVWRRLGAEVTVVEFLDNILTGMDGEIRSEAKKIFAKQGINFKLSSKVTGAKTTASGVTLTLEPASGGKSENIKADIVLMAIGRKPYVDGLGLDKVGVKLNERGQIITDEFFETSIEGVYAIGDVITGAMLAHKAEDEGVILAEMLAGQSGHIDYDCIPSVVYSWPEISSVGKTEEQLKEAGVKYSVGKFPFMANGRARAMGCMDGFVKILADSKTDRVLGAHMIGPNVGDLISEVVTVMEFEGTSEDIARICHAHPTLPEAVKEAALAVHKRSIHI